MKYLNKNSPIYANMCDQNINFFNFYFKVVKIMPKKGQLCKRSDISIIWKACISPRLHVDSCKGCQGFPNYLSGSLIVLANKSPLTDHCNLLTHSTNLQCVLTWESQCGGWTAMLLVILTHALEC